MASTNESEIVLDLSRLLSRVLHATPTGVDRCEMAYARGLLNQSAERLSFAAVHPTGLYGRLEGNAVRRFLDATEERWHNRDVRSKTEARKFAAKNLVALFPRKIARDNSRSRPIYVQASPNNLTRPNLVARILRQEDARFVCLVHDLIPLQFPEYAREGGAEDHEIRVRTIVRHAEGLVCNSHATLGALQPWFDRLNRSPTAVVANLGTHVPSLSAAADRNGRPYFICIGTIEPRKNHLLLLHLWRKMSEMRGPENIPKLIIVGRRGWENEQVVDMLERCVILKGCVEEYGRAGDQELQSLLAGARALLMPSFAEGYGMPVSEAMALNVPVVCSDLPALHEAGSSIPQYLDPLDGAAWLQAIDDLCSERSSLAAIQAQARLSWSPPAWDEHIAILLNLIHRLHP
ncbi:glycosyltransferase involved in cell wall biosynthesis [Sphingomonas vulcanisoli]|uniref:Glycosyltransferase involved in cell wall biosynthesis n=1 Tax=Sphingomonas vulcanisoli TaxID=1658060 RepID=A0ABX0TWL3_9SPHN|nr:glycosyltransferase family 1 protein [Sphingomonas vulcanisoli]NIJ09438.1 glycosyltransferase involved in cell wall biosynthesis [Sphingomonas vulcanisoli]